MIRRLLIAYALTVLPLVGLKGLSADEPQPAGDALPNLRQFTRKLFPYHDGNAWGYMDCEGKSVIAPAYDGRDDFFDDHAVLRKGDAYGILDSDGKFVLLAGFDNASRVSNACARVSKDRSKLAVLAGHYRKFSFVALDGTRISDDWYDNAGNFSEGLARVNQGASGYRGELKGGRWGYINTTGKQVIPLEFEDAGDFYEGLTRVRKNGKWGFIGRDGKFQIDPIYDYAGDFSEGVAPVEARTEAFKPSWHYVDKKGVTKIPGPYALASEFSEGRAAVFDKTFPELGEPYYIDHEGKVVIRLGLEIATNFSEGLARVWKDKKWGFIDREGKWVIEPQFEDVREFVGGLAQVIGRGDDRYINKQNMTVRKKP